MHQNRSPEIIRYEGSFFSDAHICIVTEFMDCGSLSAVMKEHGPLPERILVRVALAVLTGLDYLFEKFRVLHRGLLPPFVSISHEILMTSCVHPDVKPSNILLNSKGEIKLCDFGVSGKLVSSITTTYVGTNAYMAVRTLFAPFLY